MSLTNDSVGELCVKSLLSYDLYLELFSRYSIISPYILHSSVKNMEFRPVHGISIRSLFRMPHIVESLSDIQSLS